jgi:hypothetical protein
MRPPLPKGAAEHINEWALLAKLDDGAGLPVHLYWLRAVPQANLNDLKYVAQVYGHSKYPQTVHLLSSWPRYTAPSSNGSACWCALILSASRNQCTRHLSP